MAIDRECGEVCIATTVRDRLAICNKGQAGSPCQIMVMMMRMFVMILMVMIMIMMTIVILRKGMLIMMLILMLFLSHPSPIIA